ncbi:hypothetical protein CLU79DRAFT_773109 [Phycomyces nitens]|nr:hypothetical protein CLU79DRAFT_773109 [Phycomyces nitens]
MSYLSRDELDKYLNNLPRNRPTDASNSPSNTHPETHNQRPSPHLRGPRPPVKPAAWRSNTSQPPKPDPRSELVYPMQTMRIEPQSDRTTVPLTGITDQINALRDATGTVADLAYQTHQTDLPPHPPHPPHPPVSTPVTRKPVKVDPFEAALGPRKKPPPKHTTPVTHKDPYTNSSEAPPSRVPSVRVPQITTPDAPVDQSIDTNKRVSVPNPIYTGIRCAGCEKPMGGMTINAAGKQWHPECFVCKHCNQDLEHVAFYEKDGQPYCALDYHELFSTRCDYCGTPIEEKAIRALGKTYHEGHFFCRQCGKTFDESSAFMVHDGHPYCEKDYLEKFGHKCMGCGEYITGEFIGALGGDWHKECFVCADCGKAFTSATFFVRNNRPYCEQHQRTPIATKNIPPTLVRPPSSPVAPFIVNPTSDTKQCHRCKEKVEGRCASAYGHDYHPAHFQCSRCDKPLSMRVPGMWQEGSPGELICKTCARTHT